MQSSTALVEYQIEDATPLNPVNRTEEETQFFRGRVSDAFNVLLSRGADQDVRINQAFQTIEGFDGRLLRLDSAFFALQANSKSLVEQLNRFGSTVEQDHATRADLQEASQALHTENQLSRALVAKTEESLLSLSVRHDSILERMCDKRELVLMESRIDSLRKEMHEIADRQEGFLAKSASTLRDSQASSAVGLGQLSSRISTIHEAQSRAENAIVEAVAITKALNDRLDHLERIVRESSTQIMDLSERIQKASQGLTFAITNQSSVNDDQRRQIASVVKQHRQMKTQIETEFSKITCELSPLVF